MIEFERKKEYPDAFFVTGTDTSVGKTVVCGILMAGLGGTYWKPIQTGASEGSDAAWLAEVTGMASSHFLPERYLLKAPLSPHAAARIEGVVVKVSDFSLPGAIASPPLIVEGAGGIMVPLNSNEYMIDLIKHLGLPVIIVARSMLGTINHSLLTINQLRHYQVPITGVVLCGPVNYGNKEAVEEFGHVPVIAQVPPIDRFDFKALSAAFTSFFNLP